MRDREFCFCYCNLKCWTQVCTPHYNFCYGLFRSACIVSSHLEYHHILIYRSILWIFIQLLTWSLTIWIDLYFVVLRPKQIRRETLLYFVFQSTPNYLYRRQQSYKIQPVEGIGLWEWKEKILSTLIRILMVTLTSQTTPWPGNGPGTRRWSSGPQLRGSPGSSSWSS